MPRDTYNRPMDEVMSQIVDVVLTRMNQGWTIRQIADASGVSYSTISNWANERCTFGHTRTIFAVAKALGYRIRIVKDNAK